MIDVERWAIKNVSSGGMVGDKWSRTLWKIKPTNAMNSIAWKMRRHHIKDELKCVRVLVREIEND
tara:strand:+ start:1632 stop:1826 length:195 start_codon:yes stop_codon:yes gene_type:complete